MYVTYLKKWKFCKEGRTYYQDPELARENIKKGLCKEVGYNPNEAMIKAIVENQGEIPGGDKTKEEE